MNRLVSRLKLDVIDRLTDHNLTGAVMRVLDGVATSKGLHVLQVLAVAGVIATVYLGVHPLNALLWTFLFCCLVNISSAIEHTTKNILFIVLCLQYPLVHLMKLNFIDEVIPGATGGVLKSRTWVWGGVIVLLSVPFFSGIKNLSRVVDVATPPILLATFAALAFSHWGRADSFSDLYVHGCRYKGLHRTVFDTPLIFTTFTVMYLRNLDLKSDAARRVAYALVVCSLVVSIVFAGARSIAVSQIVTYSTCCLILAWTGSVARRLAWQLCASVALGVVFGMGLVYFVDCGANSVTRILEPGSDVSVLTRSDLYMKSLRLIVEQPIMGHGIAYESLVADPFSHVHNMYLSWALWGGVISLASGFIFLSASFLSNLGKMRQPSALILAVAILGPWGVSQLFDSFLRSPGRFYLFVLYLCLVQVLLLREAESREGDGVARNSG